MEEDAVILPGVAVPGDLFPDMIELEDPPKEERAETREGRRPTDGPETLGTKENLRWVIGLISPSMSISSSSSSSSSTSSSC